jgi:hypothetical protein
MSITLQLLQVIDYRKLEEYYPLIGEFCAIFNSIEDTLTESLISLTSEVEEIGMIIYAESSFSQKKIIWKKLCFFYSNYMEEKTKLNFRNDLEKILNEIDEISKIRNTIVHANWEDMNHELFVKSKIRNSNDGIKIQHISIDTDEFTRIIDEIAALDLKLIKFTKLIDKTQLE